MTPIASAREPGEPLRLRLVFETTHGMAAASLVTVLELIDTVLRDVEISHLERLRGELGDLPGFVFDATIERVRRTQHQALRITSATTGSIVVEGLVVALAYWLLKNTLAESLKEGYKASDLNRRLAAAVKRGLDASLNSLDEIGHRVALLASGKGIRVITEEKIERDEAGIAAAGTLELRIPAEAMPAATPTYGEVPATA